MQAATGLERNPSVSCLQRLFLAFVDDLQTRNSGSGLFPNAQNIYINDSTIVSHSCRLHKSSIIIHIAFTRSAVFTLPILAKGR